MAIREIALEDLPNDYDWGSVFGELNTDNCNAPTEPIPPGADVDNSPAKRTDVAEIIAAVNGENDEDEWVGVFLLKDGRYLVASGSCDYTGWDCRAGNNLNVAATLEDAIRYGLSDSQRERLEIA